VKILYYDCFAGISGDMNLGAMIDLGVDAEYLKKELRKIEIGSYEIHVKRDQRRGIFGTKLDVILPSGEGAPAAHGHGHRSFKDIAGLIEKSNFSDGVKSTSLAIFTKIARAEAKIHGHSIDEVHFHEVGAIDSIVDVVGAAICFEVLKVDKIIASPVQVGGGFVKCAHGMLPVPAPATAEILTGIPIRSGVVPFETTTPTGAAILAATAGRFIDRIDFTPLKIGYGIGQRDTDVPNVLRVFLGEMDDEQQDQDVEVKEACLMECNIDDMNPELYEGIVERLFEKGALDVYLTPIIMKKSRPAVKISILCDTDHRRGIEEVLWLHTSTFGLRVNRISKLILRRELSTVNTKYGTLSVKNAYLRGERIKWKLEYEDAKRLAKEKGVSIKAIYDSLLSEDV
jgi:pyridinium-3,5-bisthiocarboxylic acid mononucleotide nickel chelatase